MASLEPPRPAVLGIGEATATTRTTTTASTTPAATTTTRTTTAASTTATARHNHMCHHHYRHNRHRHHNRKPQQRPQPIEAGDQPENSTSISGFMHVYEVRPRKDHRGVDLISDVLPFGRLWYD